MPKIEKEKKPNLILERRKQKKNKVAQGKCTEINKSKNKQKTDKQQRNTAKVNPLEILMNLTNTQ